MKKQIKRLIVIPSHFGIVENSQPAPYLLDHLKLILPFFDKALIVNLSREKRFGFPPLRFYKSYKILGVKVLNFRMYNILPKGYLADFVDVGLLPLLQLCIYMIYIKPNKSELNYFMGYGGKTALDYLVLLKRLFKIKYVFTIHSFSDFEPNHLQCAEKIIVVSELLKDFILKRCALNLNKIEIVDNVIGEEFVCSPKQTITNFNVLYVATFKDGKNQEVLVKAIKILVEQNIKSFRLILVGAGPRLGIIEKLVQGLNLKQYVEFRGELSRLEVSELHKNAHCYCSSSAFETFGLNVVEALFVGRPVVVFNTGIYGELINSQNGFLVNEMDPFLFASKLLDIFRNYEIFDAQMISREANRRFDKNNHRLKYYEAIKSTLLLP